VWLSYPLVYIYYIIISLDDANRDRLWIAYNGHHNDALLLVKGESNQWLTGTRRGPDVAVLLPFKISVVRQAPTTSHKTRTPSVSLQSTTTLSRHLGSGGVLSFPLSISFVYFFCGCIFINGFRYGSCFYWGSFSWSLLVL
jgi:hypothetical protein